MKIRGDNAGKFHDIGFLPNDSQKWTLNITSILLPYEQGPSKKLKIKPVKGANCSAARKIEDPSMSLSSFCICIQKNDGLI